MDVVLEIADRNVFTPFLYPKCWPENYWLRQFLSLNFIACLGAVVIYFLFGTLSFCFVFDKRLLRHPLMLKVLKIILWNNDDHDNTTFHQNQVWLEISYTCKSIPFMGILSSVCFLGEVRGYSRLYNVVEDSKFGNFWKIL